MRNFMIIVLAASVSLGLMSASYAQKQSLPKGETRVVRVIDGDTIRVSDLRTSIRLKGFDAPEIHKNVRTGYKCDSERELGLQAKAALEELLAPPHKVVVKRSGQFDEYGRRVAVVTSDGEDVGPILIGKGLAKEWDGTPPKPTWCDVPTPSPAPERRR